MFLDRDGTINVEKNYLYRIENFEFLDGAVAALKLLQDAGYQLIIVTNQSGIARGYYSEADFQRLTGWMLRTLARQGVTIRGVYYCPHLEDAPVERYRVACDCRKPKPGLFYRAAADCGIDLAESYAVGDSLRDLSICSGTGCGGYLITENEGGAVIENIKKGKYKNIVWKRDLMEAAKDIVFPDRGKPIF